MSMAGEHAGAKILVVEDDQSVSYLICETLRDLAYDPLPVEDGRAALSIIDTFEPDGIMLDIMLPRVDGPQVVEALRATCRRSGQPMPRILIMTAGWRAKDVSSRLGVAHYLAKPFLLKELRVAVEKMLTSKEPSVDPPSANGSGARS